MKDTFLLILLLSLIAFSCEEDFRMEEGLQKYPDKYVIVFNPYTFEDENYYKPGEILKDIYNEFSADYTFKLVETQKANMTSFEKFGPITASQLFYIENDIAHGMPITNETTGDQAKDFVLTEYDYEFGIWLGDCKCNFCRKTHELIRYTLFFVRNPRAGTYLQYFNLFLGAVVLICFILMLMIGCSELMGMMCKKKPKDVKAKKEE